MALISSPITYPPSSSPMDSLNMRKRPCPQDEPAQPKPKKRLFGRNPFDAIGQSRDGVALSMGTKSSSLAVPHLAACPIAGSQDALPSPVSSPLKTIEADLDDPESSLGFLRPTYPNTNMLPLKYGLTSSGKRYPICERKPKPPQTYEKLVADRSTTAPGKSVKSYYGVDIHKLIDEARELQKKPIVQVSERTADPIVPNVETGHGKRKKNKNTMWMEKYRARKFTDLVGDERTHRTVLRWLKHWDSIVFPGLKKPAIQGNHQEDDDERSHKKLLLLTGPPGLGKTTLAHVCARQAGYEIVEINASDDRSRDVVKGTIRDCLGTENVRGTNKKIGEAVIREAGRPVCVVVDEVDGVVGGSGASGDGGFMKALIDLVMLDQRNSKSLSTGTANSTKGKKGDRFRLLRPMILICNDVYHPALRPLRSSNLAEIIHIRKPPLDKIVARMKTVFDKEGVQADGDGVRRLCEATWGISSRRDDRATSSNTGEGDIRSILVVGEWAAGKLRASATSSSGIPRLTKHWVESSMTSDLSSSGHCARGIGRGGTREVADRIFMENAGFPKSSASIAPSHRLEEGQKAVNSVSEAAKGQAISSLREAVDSCGDHDRVLSDAFSAYPSRPFQDDTFLSKPNAAHEWLHFHDTVSSRVHAGQEWELMPYLSSSILGFHYLFASSAKHTFGAMNPSANDPAIGGDQAEVEIPFTGPRADFDAYEAHKLSRATLQSLQASLSTPLHRTFRSPEDLATELLPQLVRLLAPNVQPVVVGGGGDQRGTASVRREGERAMVSRAAEAMIAVGVEFERAKVEDERGGYGGFVYRMEPPLDTLATFETALKTSATNVSPTRFAVRQVLDQELQKLRAKQASDARQARFAAGGGPDSGREGQMNGMHNRKGLGRDDIPLVTIAEAGLKRDFFGRVLKSEEKRPGETNNEQVKPKANTRAKIWVTYHEGYSNAVRKPISLGELLAGL